MINRREALTVLAKSITDEIVVSSYSSASDWIEIIDRPLNYYGFGAMGLASSHALGLAIAYPNRRVIVLDGDGSLLMNLGTLVTIGSVSPRNLTHLAFKNGSYEANGGHPIPNLGVDLAGVAKSSGIADSATVAELAHFTREIPHYLTAPGPVFRCVEIEQGPLGPRSYTEMYRKERRDAFRAALRAS